MKKILSMLILVLGMAISGNAQSAATGTVIGTVTDPSGGVVPDAVIELKDVATGVTRTAATNGAGQYSFPGVQPGIYSVKGTHAGFEEVVVPQAHVEVGKSYTINLQLRVGASQQIVEVTSTPGAELQTLDASVGSQVGGDTLMMVPTLTRNVASLLLLQPTSLPQQASTQSSTLGGQVAGAHSDQNSIVLDGGNVTNGTSGNNDYFVNFDGGPEACDSDSRREYPGVPGLDKQPHGQFQRGIGKRNRAGDQARRQSIPRIGLLVPAKRRAKRQHLGPQSAGASAAGKQGRSLRRQFGRLFSAFAGTGEDLFLYQLRRPAACRHAAVFAHRTNRYFAGRHSTFPRRVRQYRLL